MRNLKRALSLALASVMLLGMMVTGASAASYPDVDENDNVEAIEVLKAVGVMVGDEGSTDFRPDDPVTRNEMAVIMALLLKLDYNYYVTSCPFPDVPEWARGWVGACYANGIVSGRSETEYDGSATVTAVEAASMIMRAIGYFKYSSDYEPDFETSTVAQASKLQLFDGVNAGARTALTRNQVAQLTLNALETPIVEPDDDTINWTGPDGSTMTMGKVNYVVVASSQAYARAIDSSESNASGLNQVNGYIVELGEQLYNGDLKKYSNETDNFGAPATRWTYKNNKIGVYADEADYTFEGIVKSSDMYAAVGKTAAEDYRWIVKMDGLDVTPAKAVFGSDLKFFTGDDVKANDKDDLDGTNRGATTYVYLDDTGDKDGNYKGTATVCIVNTYAAEITKVVGETITLGDMDGASLEYDIAGYDEGDVVLYTKSKSGKDWTVESILGVPELIEGKPETIRDADRVVMDGTTYRYSYRFNADEGAKLSTTSVDKDVAFYLDKQGNIVMMADTSALNDYAYVYSIGQASSKYGADAEYGAKLIFTNGTTRNVDLDTDTTDPYATGADDAQKLTSVQGALVDQIVSYSEDDGLYSLEIVTSHTATWNTADDDIIKTGSTSVNLSGAKTVTDNVTRLYTDKNSAILINSFGENPDSFDAYTGFDNVPTVDATNTSKMVAYVKDGVVRALYITKADAISSKDVIFVIGQTDPEVQKTGSNSYYVYDAVVNGEITSIRVKSIGDAKDTLAKVQKGNVGIYFGMTTNSAGYVTKLNATISGDIEVNGTGKNSQTGAQVHGNYTADAYNGVSKATDRQMGFGWDDDAKEFTVRPSAKEDATIVYYDGHDLELDALHTDHNDKAWVITDDGVVTAVFVWEVDGNDPSSAGPGGGSGGSGNPSGPSGPTTTPGEGVEGDSVSSMSTASEINAALKEGNVIINGSLMPDDNKLAAKITIPAGRTLVVKGDLDASTTGALIAFTNETSCLAVTGKLTLKQSTIGGKVEADSVELQETCTISADMTVTGDLTVASSKTMTVAEGVKVVVGGTLKGTTSGSVLTNNGHIDAQTINTFDTVNDLSANSIVAGSIEVGTLNVGDETHAGNLTVSGTIKVTTKLEVADGAVTAKDVNASGQTVTVSKGTLTVTGTTTAQTVTLGANVDATVKNMTVTGTLTVGANATVTIETNLNVAAVEGNSGAKISFETGATVTGDAKDMFQAESGADASASVSGKDFTWDTSGDASSEDNAFVDSTNKTPAMTAEIFFVYDQPSWQAAVDAGCPPQALGGTWAQLETIQETNKTLPWILVGVTRNNSDITKLTDITVKKDGTEVKWLAGGTEPQDKGDTLPSDATRKTFFLHWEMQKSNDKNTDTLTLNQDGTAVNGKYEVTFKYAAPSENEEEGTPTTSSDVITTGVKEYTQGAYVLPNNDKTEDAGGAANSGATENTESKT